MEAAGWIATWFLMFLTYSFIGWFYEVIVIIFQNKKVTNRGFLIGPLCPIYGFGALVMTALLYDSDSIIKIFSVAIVASAILEYTTSYVMEKMFRVRWWDYTNKKFNVNGRICLEGLLVFAILGVVVIKITNPLLLGFFNSIAPFGRIVIAITMFLVLITDLIVTIWLMVGCRATAGTLQADATDEITANIREILMDQGKLRSRLVKAFPGMEVGEKTNKASSRKKTSTSAKKSHS